jgi:two-component system, NtrC family, nitrogen regulation sensor histidine kinase NtrY
MVYRRFYLRITIRIVVLTVALLLFAFCVVGELYLRSVYLAVFASIIAIELVYFVTKFTAHIRLFLINIQQRDFSLHFQENGGSFPALYHELNKVTEVFRKISTEKEVQFRFLQMLIEHIQIAIISFDHSGNIHFANKSFLNMVGRLRVASVDDLSVTHMELTHAMKTMRTGETQVLKMVHHNQMQNIALMVSEFKLDDKLYRLISLQNITHELNANELEAWQKLIRVLTHEIMNSVAPIVSLSDTLHTMVEIEASATIPEKFRQTLRSGLEAIKIRSKGLKAFTDVYRQLTRLATPEFTVVNSVSFVNQLADLLHAELAQRKIELILEVEEMPISIDRGMIEQAVINLLWNAIDAVSEAEDPTITIMVQKTGERICISVKDNGRGIDQASKEKIFIPFFTTKKNGSGIGLALVRQIVQIHKGTLQVETSPGQGSTFTILL